MRLAHALIALLAVTTAVAAPPAQASTLGKGTPIRVETLTGSLKLAGSGPSWRVWYVSSAWNRQPTVISGTISLPAGHPPAGGWPVISFGHGFGGVADACATSRTGGAPWERTLEETLIGAGYAVAVTDFQGIGTPGESPGVDGPSAAYAMIDIIRAARRLGPVSRSWLPVGYSLGGHAALWTGALASSYAPELQAKGTIALAPFTQWQLQVGSPLVRDPAGPASFVLPYSGRALPITHDYRPARWFTREGLDLIGLAGRICVDEMVATMAGLTNADVLKDPAAASDEFIRLFAEEETPLAGYTRPVQLIHGTADTLPAVFSEITAGQLAAAGVDATYTPVDGADHFTLLPSVAADVVHRTDAFFAVP
jgi:alpha-beta hydrolase superfamily lysophospholipase